MPNLKITEIKAFVPSKDFELSKQFYKDLGFTMASEGGGVAYFHLGHVSFLLQDFCAESLAENFMMHILVEDVNAWWNQVQQSGVLAKMASAIAEAGSNIENVSMEDRTPGLYTSLQFMLQVADRRHLAAVMRALRLIPEVVRINRARGE